MTYLELQQKIAAIMADVAEGLPCDEQIDELVEAAAAASRKVDWACEQIDEARGQYQRLKRQKDQLQAQLDAWTRLEARWKDRIKYWAEQSGSQKLDGERWRARLANGQPMVDLLGDPPPDLRRVEVEMSEVDWHRVLAMEAVDTETSRLRSGPTPWISQIMSRLRDGEELTCARLKPVTRLTITRA